MEKPTTYQNCEELAEKTELDADLIARAFEVETPFDEEVKAATTFEEAWKLYDGANTGSDDEVVALTRALQLATTEDELWKIFNAVSDDSKLGEEAKGKINAMVRKRFADAAEFSEKVEIFVDLEEGDDLETELLDELLEAATMEDELKELRDSVSDDSKLSAKVDKKINAGIMGRFEAATTFEDKWEIFTGTPDDCEIDSKLLAELLEIAATAEELGKVRNAVSDDSELVAKVDEKISAEIRERFGITATFDEKWGIYEDTPGDSEIELELLAGLVEVAATIEEARQVFRQVANDRDAKKLAIRNQAIQKICALAA
ncbi:MAG: hypothetical protein WCX12_01595 [Candidatus Paceibacterota bacterium]|jgi:hypothetical protein